MLGGFLTIEDLLGEPPCPGEDEPADATRLGHYARRMWAGLLAHEEFGP